MRHVLCRSLIHGYNSYKMDGDLFNMAHGNTMYKGEYDLLLIEMGKTGNTATQFCASVMISKQTFHNWLEKYPNFKKAYDIHSVLAESYWLQIGLDNLGNPNFNNGIYNMQLGSRFGIGKNRKIKTKHINAKDIMGSLDKILASYECNEIAVNEFESLVAALLSLSNLNQSEEITARVKALEERLAQKTDEDDE